MTYRCPDDTYVYLSLIRMLRDSGARCASELVDCHRVPALAFPLYVITALGEAKAALGSILERVLGREFDPKSGPWLLEAEEARAVAYGTYSSI